MLDNIGVFAQIEIAEFLKVSVLNVCDSFALARFVKDKRVSPYNKRYISERIIELKIPQSNYECAKFYDGEEFSANLADFGINNPLSIKEWREKYVQEHCDVIAKSKNAELNQKCLQEIQHCNKSLHQNALEKGMDL